MKIIHTADLHLESKMESNLSREQADIRRSELLDTFGEMVDYARENKVKAVMISGDMFDKSNIRKLAMRRVLDIISENSDISFLYLRGNHDCEAFDSEMATASPGNLLLFTADRWTSYEMGEDIVITGREVDEINHATLYGDLVLDPSKYNIVMLHGQESMYDGPDRTHIINLRSLQGKYIDYLALGHIHKYKRDTLDARGIYCYPGCPEPRGFDECGEKGFVVLDIEREAMPGQIKDSISETFVSCQKRAFHEIDVPVEPGDGMNDILSDIEKMVADISADDLIKIVITGKTDMDMTIDTDRIMSRFGERFFFVKVYDHTSVRIDYESYVNDRTLKGSFVRLVQDLDMPEERRSAIIETGIKAIMGEEII